MPILGNGKIFERYQIIRWLGSGTAGESYEAEDRMLLRKVTLKLIHPWATLPDFAQRQFFREMQGISTLNHPYLAAILDYGEIDGRLYIARRYVSSGSLLGPNGRLWFHAPLATASAFRYTHQLAQALHYIHQHGYLHGSLSFANVLVLRGPNIENETDYAPFLVADIGLANFVRRFGNPQIETLPVSAAPEQLGKQTTPASDQFALAVLLYFWLAGRPPYLGAAGEVEQLKLTETITPLSMLNPGITPEQDSIILRALMASPQDRYPSVLAFAESLLTSLSFLPPTHPAFSGTFLAHPETPRALLRFDLDKAPIVAATGMSEEAELQYSPILSPATPTGEEPPVSLPLEPSHSALEELLSPPEQELALPATIVETPHLEETTVDELTMVEQIADESAMAEEAAPALPESELFLTDEVEAQPASDELTEQSANNISDLPAPALESDVTGDADTISVSGEVEVAESQTVQSIGSTSFPYLLVSSPYTNNSYEFLLIGEETNVGRAGASDLLLDQDDLTSRHHALLKRVGERVLIFDKRSYNGIFINGQKIEVARDYELADGDHIGIGNYELIFRSALGKDVSRLI